MKGNKDLRDSMQRTKKGKGGRKRLPPGDKVMAVDVYVTTWEVESAGGIEVIRALFRKYWSERIKPHLKRGFKSPLFDLPMGEIVGYTNNPKP